MSEAPPHARLIEAIAEGMYVVDRDRKITFWNGAAERITGYTAETVLGRSCGDGLLNHIDESGASMCGDRCPLLETIQDGVPRSTRVFAHHRDGHVVPVCITAGALRDEDGVIVGAVETFRDDSAMKSTERRLRVTERLAMTDPLTGLGNRRLMDHRLDQRLASATHDERFGVIVVDLDDFKAINDAHGHSWGDRALSVVARTLRAVVGVGGDVTRFGGDEFVIITETMAPDRVGALARDVRVAVDGSWVEGRHSTMRVSASVGAAMSCVGDSAESIVERADEAMLEAKKTGEGALMAVECPRQDSNLRPSD